MKTFELQLSPNNGAIPQIFNGHAGQHVHLQVRLSHLLPYIRTCEINKPLLAYNSLKHGCTRIETQVFTHRFSGRYVCYIGWSLIRSTSSSSRCCMPFIIAASLSSSSDGSCSLSSASEVSSSSPPSSEDSYSSLPS